MNKRLASACLAVCSLTAQAYPDAGEPKHEWSVDVAPYIWAIKLNGDAGVAAYTVPIDQNFASLLSQLNWAGMIFIDVRYNRLGIFLDTVFTKLSNSTHVDGFEIKMTNVYGIVTPGLSFEAIRYPVSDQTQFILEPYVGERLTTNNTTLKIEGVGNVTSDQTWVDALIGARFTFKFGPAWTLSVAADIGGTTSSDQNSYNAIALAGYQFPYTIIPISIFGGYRYLHQKYIIDSPGDNFAWDMALFGPFLGLNLRF